MRLDKILNCFNGVEFTDREKQLIKRGLSRLIGEKRDLMHRHGGYSIVSNDTELAIFIKEVDEIMFKIEDM